MAKEQIDVVFQDVFADRLGYVLRRASGVMMSALGGALARVELRPVEATILILIGANQGSSQSDVGRVLGIKRANMVPLIAGLIAKDLIKKSPADGRSHALSLTEQGVARRDAADAIMLEHERRFEAFLAPELAESLRAGLARLTAAADDAAA
jgi:DNA-binding MarR family transcriptional regulator